MCTLLSLPPHYSSRAAKRGAEANADATSIAMAMPQPTYPTYGHTYPPNDTSTHTPKPAEDFPAYIARTPSPTNSEIDFLNGDDITIRQIIRRYLVIGIIVAVIAVVESEHAKILSGLSPATDWLRRTMAAWLVPIAVLVALSFPPLFGHEIVAMLCGVAWGLGKGFGIVAAGTLWGEICTFFSFKYVCGGRARKAEATNMGYATLARVVRNGGLVIPIIMRYSAMPAHFTTALFATCGMPFWVFLVAAIVSLPKQLVTVYIGVALNSNSSESEKIQKIVLVITILITVLAMAYLRRLREAAKPAVVHERRKARQMKLRGGVEDSV
ncbi:hypothetical protein DFH07DRAFT_1008481 [Mycena maculata]|uniref:Golgi apparatus membrane protein TVP38 n=1 Tax=Mycena maculata TaxID=230809 RepID=A0AAD7HH63_9AGAR|nr:hypothetical protein DFH07DRAFT_1008481 [Mycena maculata]